MIGMRLRQWLTAGLFLLAGVFLQTGACASTSIVNAEVRVEVDGQPAQTSMQELPLNWDRHIGGRPGRAHLSTNFHWSGVAQPQAIYLRRIGNTFSIYINGKLIAKMGGANPGYEDYAKKPRLFVIPHGVLAAENRLDITIEAQNGRHAGISQIEIGDVAELQAWQEREYAWYVNGSLGVAIASIVLGLFALLLWLRQRERIFLFYCSGELLWALQVIDVQLDVVPLAWPLWGVLVSTSYIVAPVLISLFSLELADLRRGRLHSVLYAYMLLSLPVAVFSFWSGMAWTLGFWKLVLVMMILAAAIAILRRDFRSQRLEQKVLMVAVVVTVLISVRDVIVLLALPMFQELSAPAQGYGQIPWSRFSWVLFGVAMAWAISERLRSSSIELGKMNETLTARLAEREVELKQVFAQQAKTERQQATMEERQRLTQDMHDGLGSQLLYTLLLAEKAEVPRTTLTAELRETLDHLKLTVDAMHDTEGDIGVLLGALRYRLAPRLEAAGVSLQWDVDHLPVVPDWNLNRSRDLQMILFEAFSNIIRHSGASQARLEARLDEGCVHITLSDNGKGFADEASHGPRGQGMRNMQARAARLMAVLHIDGSNGFRIGLSLPLH